MLVDNRKGIRGKDGAKEEQRRLSSKGERKSREEGEGWRKRRKGKDGR